MSQKYFARKIGNVDHVKIFFSSNIITIPSHTMCVYARGPKNWGMLDGGVADLLETRPPHVLPFQILSIMGVTRGSHKIVVDNV